MTGSESLTTTKKRSKTNFLVDIVRMDLNTCPFPNHHITPTRLTPLCSIQMSHSIFSLMSQSVIASLLPLPSSKHLMTTSMIKLTLDTSWLYNRGRKRALEMGSQWDKCKWWRKGNTKERWCIPGCTLWRKLTPNGSEGVEHFHSLLLCNAFLIRVRLESHTGGNITGWLMF